MRQQMAGQRDAGPILVAAQTNTAVDNILRKLSAIMSKKGTHHSAISLLPQHAHTTHVLCNAYLVAVQPQQAVQPM